MRATPLMLAIALGLGLPANQAALAASSELVATHPAGKSIYIVVFDEPPVALFTGFSGKDGVHPHLAATSTRMTGAAKLDVNSVESRAYRGYLHDLRTSRVNNAAVMLGRPLTPIHVYDVATNGMAIALTAAEADRLSKMPGIKHVHPDFVREPLTDRGPRWIKADKIWDGTATSGLKKKGEGVVVGVIDTGVNAAHDSFKATGPVDGYVTTNARGHFYGICATDPTNCNNKLIGIWDFTTGDSVNNEADNGLDNYVTDPNGTTGQYGPCRSTTSDPNECVGHGSHTASTAAGNTVNVTLQAGDISLNTQMSGVAPHANIITYKACEAVSSCVGSWLIAAIDQAVADQVDVINFSIGGPASDPWSGFSTAKIDDDAEAFLAARTAGITVAAAAGNDGPEPGTHGNPANAPWVIGVAAATHDRVVLNRLVDMTGGATSPPNGGVMVGTGDITSPTSTSLLPIVAATDYPLCADGSDPDGSPATGVSKPASWNSSTWAGKIVVCTRGYYARVAKSNNVRLGGGSGMVLVNSAAEGESTNNDDHTIPSTHMTYSNGQALLSWLSTGSGHKARLQGTSIGSDASYGDRLADFSGRGPVVPLGVIKPDITAPGVNIIAASNSKSSCTSSPTSCYNYLSGTSMATPHVAGSVALLKSVHPTWTPSQITSALMLTARPSVKVSDGSIGTPHDQGSGMVDLSLATKAGLYLNVTDAQFRAADTTTARDLNLPSLAHEDCFISCSLTRTFTDMVGGGKWGISGTLPAGATLTPSISSFTIGSGASQAVTFNFNVDDASLVGKWIYGSVTLTDQSGNGRPPLTLPVALFVSPGNIPASINQGISLDRGHFDVTLSGVVSMPNAHFRTPGLYPVKNTVAKVRQDTTTGDPYDNLSVVYKDLITVPMSNKTTEADLFRIHVSTSSSASKDADLYVGRDDNGDGLPSADEVLCTSATNGATESCDLDVPGSKTNGTSPKYWLLVQNFNGSTNFALDPIDVQSYVAAESFGSAGDAGPGSVGGLVVTGPGHASANTDVPLRMNWDLSTSKDGETYMGYVFIEPNGGADVAQLPVFLTRTGNVFAPYALADKESRTITLTAGASHDKLFFDVPPNIKSVKFDTSGTGNVKLELFHIDTPVGPTIDAAPAVTPDATSSAAGASQSITLTGAALKPGRWYLKPTNTGSTDASVTLSATTQTSTSTSLGVLPGSYYDPARPGHGVFVYPSADQWQLIWYTYLQDGTPTWYFVQANAPDQFGLWSGILYRSAWNGSSNHLTQVGNLLITPTSSNTFTMSYNIDGETGSESMSAFITGCPVANSVNLDDSTHWYSPGHDGFGYSVQVNPNYEFIADFVYDAVGVPRFLVAERLGAFDTAATSLPLDQLTGFCPLCTATSPTRTTVGTLTRTYSGSTIATMGSTLTFTGGVPGSWDATFPVTKLGLTQGCGTP